MAGLVGRQGEGLEGGGKIGAGTALEGEAGFDRLLFNGSTADDNIDISANTPEVGEAKESLAVAYKGRDFSIAFNPEFLMARGMTTRSRRIESPSNSAKRP